MLKTEKGIQKSLTEYWTAFLRLHSVVPYVKMDGDSKSKLSQAEEHAKWKLDISLFATASKYEFDDLCNIWSRPVIWGARVQTKGGSVVKEINMVSQLAPDTLKTDTCLGRRGT